VEYVVELSGEQPDLALGEVAGALRALDPSGRVGYSTPEVAVVKTSARPEVLCGRLALAYGVDEVLWSGPTAEVARAAGEVSIPPGTLEVRVVAARETLPPGLRSAVVGQLTNGRRVDLKGPDLRIRWIASEGVSFIAIDRGRVDRSAFEKRKLVHRPYRQPISLHPKFARALVNLSAVGPGEVFLDPFAGTGGIVIEASLVGARAIGGDIRPEAVEGCRASLQALGLEAELHLGDAEELLHRREGFSALASDLPYGRSSTTRGEALQGLARRFFCAMAEALPPSGRAAVILPSEELVALASSHFQVAAHYRQRVHRSLTRNYVCLVP
jgi:tRNA (guanine10-N2)-dimethyltransferase